MNKKITWIFFSIALLLQQSVFSQSFLWGMNIGQHTGDSPVDLDKTSDGVLLTTTPSIYNNIYGLNKYDSDGNLIWESSIFSTLANTNNYGFLGSEVDENDNIYSLINLEGPTVTINDVDIENGISLIKIDSSGNLIWSKKIGGQDVGMQVVYKNNMIYVLGHFYDTININNEIVLNSQQYWDCFSLIYRTGEDYFIAKFDNNGTLINAISFGEDYPDLISNATIDDNSNLYITGVSDYYGACGSTNYTHISKFNSNLEQQWVKILSEEDADSWLFLPSNLYFSSSNNKIYLWGYTIGAVVTSDYTIPDSPCINRSDSTGAGGNLLEFDAVTGDFVKFRHYPICTLNYIWGVGGNFNTIYTTKAGISELGNDLIILSSIHGSMDFDNGTFESTHLISEYDEFIWDENLFLMRVNKDNFNSEFIANFPGEETNVYPESVDNPNKIIVDGTNLYLSASFECNPIHVLGYPINNNSGNNDGDILISKINLSGLLSNGNDNFISDFKVHPNPTDGIINIKSKTSLESVKIFSVTGKILFNQTENLEQINIKHLSKGIYFLNIVSKKGTVTKKIIRE